MAALDVLIRGGRIVDGTGNPWFYGDVGIAGDRIAAILPPDRIDDAGGVDPVWAERFGPTHPRAYGTFTRVLAQYVRGECVLPVQEAIRKMTSAVADRIAVRDRGLLREGAYADLVVFDLERVQDHATFDRPHQFSTGIRDVWINGGRALEAGQHTGATSGRFLRGPGAR